MEVNNNRTALNSAALASTTACGSVPITTATAMGEASAWRSFYGHAVFEQKQQEQPMETLFNVIVVSKDREIFLDIKAVGVDEDDAKFNADVNTIIKLKGLKPRDVTVICYEIGEVKVQKEVQKVKLVDKDEE